MAALQTKEFVGSKSNNNQQSGQRKNNSNGSANQMMACLWILDLPLWVHQPKQQVLFKVKQKPIQCYECGQ